MASLNRKSDDSSTGRVSAICCNNLRDGQSLSFSRRRRNRKVEAAKKMTATKEGKPSTKRDTDWTQVTFLLHINVLTAFGFYYLFSKAYITTIIFSFILVLFGLLGTTAGCHRLWAHRSYKASTRLRIFLMLCQTLTAQGPIYNWVLNHRLHHKHFRTDLDPYNPSRGLFFAHVIGNALANSPAMEESIKEIDMSDVENDSVVMFQKKYYWLLFVVLCCLLPVNAPAEYWGESLLTSLMVAGVLRIGICLHLSWLIHSATLIWGLQPGEKFPCDTNLVFILTKSYWLPYHYLTPWDYQTSEYGQYGDDCVSKFIRICAALGDATELRTLASEDVREALSMSVDTKKEISECLLEVEKKSNLPADHYLEASKYC